MKRLIHLVTKIYPRAWRDHYGEEFEALLKEVPPGWRPFFDVLRGGLAMQFRMWNAGRILAAMAIAGSMTGLFTSMAVPKQYASDAVIQQTFPVFESAPAAHQAVSNRLNDLVQTVLSQPSLARIIDQFGLYESERAKAPLEDVIGTMRNTIRIRPLGPSRDLNTGFVVQFTYPDPAMAQRVTQELVGSFMDQVGEDAVRKTPVTLLITRPASLPNNALGPSWWGASGTGLVASLLLGLLMLAFRRSPRSV